MDTIRRHVHRACVQALDAHETEHVNYNDALYTAQRMYCNNWKLYREARGFWSEKDEVRARKFTLPNGAARRIFDNDFDIQQLLVSRDNRLNRYRHKLEDILVHTTHLTFQTVMDQFIEFCNTEYPTPSYPWRGTFDGVVGTFPRRDTWAIWISLRDLWPNTAEPGVYTENTPREAVIPGVPAPVTRPPQSRRDFYDERRTTSVLNHP